MRADSTAAAGHDWHSSPYCGANATSTLTAGAPHRRYRSSDWNQSDAWKTKRHSRDSKRRQPAGAISRASRETLEPGAAS
jgi:hypothetical protein